MNNRLRMEHPIDRYGRIRPVADMEYVGNPVVAYIIRMEDGFYVSINHQMVKRESLSEAMGYIENVRSRG